MQHNTTHQGSSHRSHHSNAHDLLAELAASVMAERGLAPEFSRAALEQMASIKGPSQENGPGIADMTGLLWCSIDNDESRDLDQLSVCEPISGGPASGADRGGLRIHVAVADVDCLVRKDSPIDQHARTNTTSIYTSARIFPMLPEQLSTDWTSLNPGVPRLAMVASMDFAADGKLVASRVQRARVHNKAKLAYDGVAAWLDGKAPMPAAAAAVPGMEQQIRSQDAMAQQMRALRREQGSLEFQSFQPRAQFDAKGQVVGVAQQEQNRARQLIEELMVATNGVVASFLAGKGRASLRRVVRSPERWQRICEVVNEYGTTLPPEPDSRALQAFLAEQRRRDPLRFPDLSLTLIKLMGAGEYVVEVPGGPVIGHFGLAVRDYSHSTAPNRRYPDLITSRLVKAALAGVASPYSADELARLATQCSQQEDAANKVERQMRKSEAALVLQRRRGEVFDGVIAGLAKGNTWVRIFSPPAEGMLRLRGAGHDLRVGRRVKVRLDSTDVQRGFIDFDLVS